MDAVAVDWLPCTFTTRDSRFARLHVSALSVHLKLCILDDPGSVTDCKIVSLL